jgi:hypothetical protein
MNRLFVIVLIIFNLTAFAQVDTEQLSLDISKADAANTEQLKNFIWKRYSAVMVAGEPKLTTITEFSFDESGKLVAKLIDAESSVKQKPGIIEATAKDIFIKGDVMTIQVESSTKLFLRKKFSSLLETDPISGEINYTKFSSGVNHGSTTVLNLPSKKAVINAENKDYSQRVK